MTNYPGIKLAGLSESDIETIAHHYLVAQLWAQLDMETEEPLDATYEISDISPDYVESLTDEIARIIAQHPIAFRMYAKQTDKHYQSDSLGQFGHDLYLTREGHGAGFWDRGLGELGDYWTQISHDIGEAEMLYQDADGNLSA